MVAVSSSSSSSSSNPSSDSNSKSDKASSTPSSSSSFLTRSQTYALLTQQMAVAANSEDYKEAARIRDSLKSFEAEEPVLCLRGLLRKAVEEERFEVQIKTTCPSEPDHSLRGVGVIGEQPVILPKAGFECLSACPLCSPNGRMEGDFEMKAYR